MVYAAPTRELLRQGVSRDVQDPDNNTFVTDEVNDLINEGIVELNRLRPKEYLDDLVLTDGVYEYDLRSVGVNDIFRLEVWRSGAYYHNPSRLTGVNSTTGWDFFAGRLFIPATWALDTDVDQLRIWGYADRETLSADEEVFDAVGPEDEQIVRAFCKYTIFQRLVSDRALFQQWQTQSNNTDVSATQLLGMQQVAFTAWRELKGRARLLRRVE